ncbi:MAG: helix-turn-helix domain-containing protein [Bacteriovoracaceae bacterium]
MTTKKKSKAIKFLDKVIGASMTFGSNLEAIRLADSKSQIEFAKRLGISQAHLSQLEKGIKSVAPERAQKFARILGYSEVTFVELALRDQLRKAGIKMKIHLEAA